jgi:hypothetical protein
MYPESFEANNIYSGKFQPSISLILSPANISVGTTSTYGSLVFTCFLRRGVSNNLISSVRDNFRNLDWNSWETTFILIKKTLERKLCSLYKSVTRALLNPITLLRLNVAEFSEIDMSNYFTQFLTDFSERLSTSLTFVFLDITPCKPRADYKTSHPWRQTLHSQRSENLNVSVWNCILLHTCTPNDNKSFYCAEEHTQRCDLKWSVDQRRHVNAALKENVMYTSGTLSFDTK